MASIRARILIDLAGDTENLIDVTSRCIQAFGSYGRWANLFDYRSGFASVVLSVTDNFLVPGLEGATYRTDNLKGRRVQIDTRVTLEGVDEWRCVFLGVVDRVDYTPREADARAAIRAVDPLAQLASQTLELGTPPEERTGARLSRILEAAGYEGATQIDQGTVTCVAPTQTTRGNALALARQVADTEGGRLFIQQNTAAPGTLRFLQRDAPGEASLTVADSPAGGEAAFAGYPASISDPRLVVTATRFTDGFGVEHVRENPVYVAAFGREELQRNLLSDADAVESLSEWWISIFGQPVARLDRIDLEAHFEAPTVALSVLELSVGSVVETRIRQPGATRATTQLYSIDGVSWKIWVLDAAVGDVGFTGSYTLFPPPVRLYWLLGDSERGVLDSTTALAAPQRSDPGGRIWVADQLVTADRFQRVLASSRQPIYATVAEREVGDPFPVRGQQCVLLEDSTIRMWDGVKWRSIGRW